MTPPDLIEVIVEAPAGQWAYTIHGFVHPRCMDGPQPVVRVWRPCVVIQWGTSDGIVELVEQGPRPQTRLGQRSSADVWINAPTAIWRVPQPWPP